MENESKTGIVATSVGLLVLGLVVGYLIGHGGATPVLSQDWKTYTDPRGAFSVQYPKEYNIIPMDLDDGSYGVGIGDKNMQEMFDSIASVNVKPDTNIMSLDTYVADLSKQYEQDAKNSAAGVNFTTEPTTVDGVQGYALFSAEGSAMGNVDVTYYFLKSGTLYTLNSRFDNLHPEAKDMIENIVSTFKFTK